MTKFLFTLSKEQEKKLEAWITAGQRDRSRATSGERLEYAFIPTSLGVIIIVRDLATKEAIDLTDYDNW